MLIVKLASRLIVLALALTLPRGLARCASAVLAAGGTFLTVCASGCDFTTIQAALDDATTTAGDTILILDSVRTEAGITVRKDVTIQGQGADKTTVQAHATMEQATDRVFLIAEGAIVTLQGLSMRHGNPSPDELYRCGGGIANLGTLIVKDCVIHHNTANDGGGIWSREAALTVHNSTVHHNTADRMAVEADRTVSGAGLSTYACGSGGGIKLSPRVTMTVTNSTIHDNEAKSHGGGLFVACESTATLTNCTISGNSAVTWGGGVHSKNVVHLIHCTVTGNQALAECAAGQLAERCPKGAGGGGVFVRATLHLTNTIIAGNGTALDCALGRAGEYGMTVPGEIITNANSWVGDASCEAAYSGDPLLGPLADNGGTTQTHALLSGSPAIDAVPAVHSTVATDQRGLPRPVACGFPEAPADLGAFEVQADQCPAAAARPTQSITAEARGNLWPAGAALLGLLLLGAMAASIAWRWRRGR